MTRKEGRGGVVRPTLCGLLILASVLPFVAVAPRLKGEFAHMQRSDVSFAPVAVPAPSVEGDDLAHGRQAHDGRLREASTR